MKKLITLILVLFSLVFFACAAVFVIIRYVEVPIDDVLEGIIDVDNDDNYKPNKEVMHFKDAEKYREIIVKYADEYEVPVALVCAVIECESGFREDAKSHVGACGLMQLMPVTFNDICIWLNLDYTEDQIMDPEINIRLGTYYLSRMYRMFDDWELAVAAYNAGPGNVQKWLKNDDYTEDGKLVYIPFNETSNHVKKVVRAWEKYEEQLKG